MIVYEDFDVRVQSNGDRFVVRAQLGSQFATEPLAVDRVLSKEVRHLEGADPELIRRRGADLFDALISGRVRDLYEQGRGRVGDDSGAGLRIRLLFNPGDERVRPLIALPWEIIRDRSDDAHDLPALDSRRPIVRTIESVAQRLTPAGGALQRVLLALADPVASRELHSQRERAAVEQALARISIQPVVVQHATRATLFEAIADEQFQIVHFMGHSRLDSKAGEVVLSLEDGEGGEERLSGSAFAGFFVGRPAPRLLILTSCLSAMEGDEPFAGIAFALVAAGLPAVIAMQSRVRDDSSVRFTERLYRRLSDGAPIEAAVADARRALSIGWPDTPEWASPVLFTRDEPAPAPAPPSIPIKAEKAPEPIHTPSAYAPVITMNVAPVQGGSGTTIAGYIQNFNQGKGDA